MLSKLLKYEFKATARIILPLYLVTILLALGTRGTLFLDTLDVTGDIPTNLLGFLSILVVAGFVIGLIAIFAVTVVMMILRFRNNLLTDEGYVMFTLPVSAHQLVWSKLITSTVWFLGAFVITGFSILVILGDVNIFRELIEVVRTAFDELSAYYIGNGIAFLVELIVLVLLGCFASCLEFYAPLSIGHAFAKHKMLLSVVFFFVIGVVTDIIEWIFILVGMVGETPQVIDLLSGMQPVALTHTVMLGCILLLAVYGAVLYGITIRMLHRHLNLE